MKNSSIKKASFYILATVSLLVMFAGGVYVGYAHVPLVERVAAEVTNKEAPVGIDADFSEYWKVWQLMNDKFVTADQTDAQTRVYGSIQGMLASFGDPYTDFFTPSENDQFQSQVSGQFGGIGLEVGEKDGVLVAIAPLKGTPAEAAGIKAGDFIVKINGVSTDTMDIDDAVDAIRGQKGTTVTLTIDRASFAEPKDFTITRDTINEPTIDTLTYPSKSTFVIKLYSFSAQSASLFAQAIAQYQQSGDQNLILDLRNNPGGYLDAAVDIAGWFLPQGDVVVKEIGRNPATDTTIHTSDGPDTIHPAKMYILVNQGSASAAEILSGALSEHGVATLVGERTFGKGSVQELIPLDNDTSVKITVAKWYTPDGISISEKGLTPQIALKMGDAAPAKTSPTDDPELDQVLALIK